jgi:hypothetical protein
MSAKPVSVHAAKANLSRLIERACAGEEVVITRRFGAMKGRASTTKAFFEPLADQELELWEG